MKITNYLVPLSFVLLCTCNAPSESDSLEVTGVTSDAISTVDVISPTNCTLRLGRLVRCTVSPFSLDTLEMETAVPLRTQVDVTRTGNCATQYPLELNLAVQGEPTAKINYAAGNRVTLRRLDRLAIPRIDIWDASMYTYNATFGSDCRIAVKAAFNEPDVDSFAEANKIIAELSTILQEKIRIRDNTKSLTLYHGAYKLMKELAANFLVELTNDTIQELRDSAEASKDQLEQMILNCNDVSLSAQDRINLLRLHSSLAVLGSSSDWKNPDGSPMTLGDFLGPADQGILATVDALAKKADDTGGYGADLKTAEEAVVIAQHKLELGKLQLSSWLWKKKLPGLGEKGVL